MSYLRGKSRIDFGPKVVRIKDEHANHERQKHHNEQNHELEYVLHCPSKGDLQGPKALVCREDVCDPGEAEYHRYSIEAFGYDLRVRREPFISS